jgi:hypothetical protein
MKENFTVSPPCFTRDCISPKLSAARAFSKSPMNSIHARVLRGRRERDEKGNQSDRKGAHGTVLPEEDGPRILYGSGDASAS